MDHNSQVSVLRDIIFPPIYGPFAIVLFIFTEFFMLQRKLRKLIKLVLGFTECLDQTIESVNEMWVFYKVDCIEYYELEILQTFLWK